LHNDKNIFLVPSGQKVIFWNNTHNNKWRKKIKEVSAYAGSPGKCGDGDFNFPLRTEQVQALADISRLTLCCHSNEPMHPLQICLIVHNWRAPHTIPQTYVWVHAVVWECGEGQTGTCTDVTNMHFTLATPHMKCNFHLLKAEPAC